jgi:hypothetical protein
MMIQIKNQVFVPESQVKRISFFADYALIKYVDHSDERVDGDDAERLRLQFESVGE